MSLTIKKREGVAGGESLKKKECQASESESQILADFQFYYIDCL